MYVFICFHVLLGDVKTQDIQIHLPTCGINQWPFQVPNLYSYSIYLLYSIESVQIYTYEIIVPISLCKYPYYLVFQVPMNLCFFRASREQKTPLRNLHVYPEMQLQCRGCVAPSYVWRWAFGEDHIGYYRGFIGDIMDITLLL